MSGPQSTPGASRDTPGARYYLRGSGPRGWLYYAGRERDGAAICWTESRERARSWPELYAARRERESARLTMVPIVRVAPRMRAADVADANARALADARRLDAPHVPMTCAHVYQYSDVWGGLVCLHCAERAPS